MFNDQLQDYSKNKYVNKQYGFNYYIYGLFWFISVSGPLRPKYMPGIFIKY